MKRKVFLLTCVWLTWLAFVLTLPEASVNEDLVRSYSGKVEAATCVTTRSVNAVKLKVVYKGSDRTVEELYNLPGKHECDQDFIAQVTNRDFHISKYKNRYLAMKIGDLVIRTPEEGVSVIEDQRGSIAFSFVLALIASALVAVWRGRR